MNAPTLDLTKRHWTATRGELMAIGSWIRLDDRWRPCMAIIRTGDDGSERAIPCVVTIDKAWIWSEEIGDSREAARSMVGFLEALRLNPQNFRNHHRVFSLIADHLGDLLKMPPYQADRSTPILDVTIQERETGRIREVEISEDV
ncbi:hypothetical protein [Aminobacter sp. MDW-2]|uniref:hypothetical protein n=1 Tax=Aminobacter sp. MDW-2 TaxID=2666139 RepID=UPI0012B05C63|nr:hypothetical protein [Aminobacter sp. MDW-2]MRX32817.1 hypothetical protein [Aminobacter sp. MDW-2]QNH34524.1 hypothetical protein H5P29_00790 [Aminobacter sp. MDW-2]